MQDGRHSDDDGKVAGNLETKRDSGRRPAALITEGQGTYLQLLARFCPPIFNGSTSFCRLASGKVRLSGTWMSAFQDIGCKFDLEEHHKCVN